MLIALILVVGLIVLPAAYLVWRFRRGGEAVGGGSLGSQLFGRRKEGDWGPK